MKMLQTFAKGDFLLFSATTVGNYMGNRLFALIFPFVWKMIGWERRE